MKQEQENNLSEQEIEAQKHTKGGSALAAAGVARSATAQVDPHSNSGLASTGTNISYDGATAPGGGGSVGTGYASGKEATGEKLTTGSDYEQGWGGSPNKTEKVSNKAEANEEDEDLEGEDLDEDLDEEGMDEESEEDEDESETDEMR